MVTGGNGEVVGHLAALPQYSRIAGQRVVALSPASYQVLPGYGRHAVFVIRRLFDTAENCVICNRVPAVIGDCNSAGSQGGWEPPISQ